MQHGRGQHQHVHGRVLIKRAVFETNGLKLGLRSCTTSRIVGIGWTTLILIVQ